MKTSGVSLYEIENKRLELFEALTSDDDAIRQQAQDELTAISEVRDDKLSACCAHLKNLIAEEEITAKEAKRLKDKADDCAHRAEKFKQYIALCWPDKTEKWSNGVHTIGWRKCPPSVVVLDEAKVPPAYMKEKIAYAVDKKQALIDLANNAKIPGLALELDKFSLTVK